MHNIRPLSACFALFLLLSSAASASNSQLLLGELGRDGNQPRILSLMPVTPSQGYHNQPFFHPDEPVLFYTAELSGQDGSQMDSMALNLDTMDAINLTQSSQSEYSPTLMTDGQGLSVIRVDDEGKQWLWRFSLAQPDNQRLLDIEPIGYHAWVDDTKAILFVLGSPNSLQLASIVSGKSVVLDRHIGPSLYQIPATTLMSYSKAMSKDEDPRWIVRAVNPATGDKQDIAVLPKGAYYYAWLPEGKLIAAVGTRLYYWDGKNESHTVTSAWVPFAQVASACAGTITRLAVNPTSNRIALVCQF